MTIEIIAAILGSSLLASIVSGLFAVWKDRKHHNDGVTAGVRMVLYDRIKFLGREYIRKQEISYEDLEDIIEMHRIYHDDLAGNGYLDNVMAAVKKLPIVDK